jgi:Tol biopolymer transport system component
MRIVRRSPGLSTSSPRSRADRAAVLAALIASVAAAGAAIPCSPAAANDVSWITPRGGLYLTGANWNTGSPPSVLDRAVFQLSGAYSVLFDAPAASGGLLVSAGQVTFDLGRFGFTSNGNVEVVATDTMLNILGNYAQSAGSFDVRDTASVHVTGSFNYVGDFDQNFLIRGTGFSVGDVAGSSINAGFFQVSGANDAHFNDVTVLRGAEVISDSTLTLLGDFTQTSGTFDVRDAAALHVAGSFNYVGDFDQNFLIRGTGFSVGDVAGSSINAGFFQVSGTNDAHFNDITVLRGAEVISDSTLTLLGDFTQTSGTFDVRDGGSITVGGTFGHTAGTALIRGEQFAAQAASIGADGMPTDFLVFAPSIAAVATTFDLGAQAIANVTTGGRLHIGSVADPSAQPEVRVGGGGTLVGDGQVNGNVVVEAGGAVSPAPGVGSLTVAGSYTALDAAGLSIDLGSASPQPQLAIGGTAQLDGTITVTFEPGYDVARGELVTLVSAGEISGAFDIVNLPSGYDLVYGTNTVSIKRSSVVIALSVQLESSEIPVGFGTQVAAVASYADGTTADVTAMTTWSSSAPSIASVSASGVVLGLSPGLASIEGAFGGFDEAATLSVSAIPRDWATSRVSVNASGTEGNGPSVSNLYFPSLSSDGRLVCFEGTSTNLVPSDTNGFYDVFVKDLESGLVERVSVATDGTQANGASYASNMSDDGRFVAFTSDATNLSAADGAPNRDTYLRDRETGVTTCISCSVPGADNQYGVLSGDGRYILITTTAAHDPVDTNGLLDLYRFDRILGTFQLVSRGLGNTAANGVSVGTANAISRTGRFVNFRSTATNLVPSDTNGRLDVFLADLETGTLELVSVGPGGVQSDGDSLESSISDDGRYVAFLSFGSNLTEATDTNGQRDGFVRDRVTGENIRVSDAPDGSLGNGITGSLSMTPDGRYVAFRSASTNLLAGDRNAVSDVFRREVATGTLDWVSEALTGFANGESSFGTDMTPDGGLIVFGSLATNLVPFDQNGAGDVFVRSFDVAVSGDLDGDEDVDAADLGLLLGAWGTGDPSADLDGNGIVDAADLAIILGAWQ